MLMTPSNMGRSRSAVATGKRKDVDGVADGEVPARSGGFKQLLTMGAQ
jgi:hypothetical protein